MAAENRVIFLQSTTNQTRTELRLKHISTKEGNIETLPLFQTLNIITSFFSFVPTLLVGLPSMLPDRWIVRTLRKEQRVFIVSEKLPVYFSSELIFLGTIIAHNNGNIYQ